MSDLISRQALIKSINTQILGMSGFAVEIRQDLINIVASQPVAYDVDKVVSKIEEYATNVDSDCDDVIYSVIDDLMLKSKEVSNNGWSSRVFTQGTRN